MKKTHKRVFPHAPAQTHSALLVLSIAFILGGLLGSILAASVSGSGSAALSTYIKDFLTALQSDAAQAPKVFSTLWSVLRWPLIAILLSFTSLGLIGIPALFFVRGFLFSFCVSAFVQVLGARGLLFALLLLGVESLLSIPVLFILGAQGFLMSAQVKERKGRAKTVKAPPNKPLPLLSHALCFFLLLFCTLWELFFLPMLLSSTSHFFSI